MESSEPAPEPTLLQRIRNTWEFSNLMQFIFIFGKAVKIDEDFSIEVGPPNHVHRPIALCSSGFSAVGSSTLLMTR